MRKPRVANFNRSDWRMTAAFGFLIGLVSFVLAMSLIPSNAGNPGVHDRYLAQRLGWIFPLLVALWLGWVQHSVLKTLLALLIGTTIGMLYGELSKEPSDFFAIMVAFPCACGGLFAALVGSITSSWWNGLFLRLLKGLLAGSVLGFVYMVILNVGILFAGGFAFGPEPVPLKEYRQSMWQVGPWALGFASALFLPLLGWAVRLRKSE